MANTKQILTALSRQSGLPLVRNRFVLYSQYFEFYAQGLAIEQTGYKDEVYLRTYCSCFFKKIDFIHVSYSPRLKSCEEPRAFGFTGSNNEIQRKILDRIEELETMPAILEQLTARQFLRRFEAVQLERPSAFELFDVAASAVLDGRLSDAEHYLEITRQQVEQSSRDEPSKREFLLEIGQLRNVLGKGRTAATAFLTQTSARNAGMLGFRHAPESLILRPL